MTLHSCQAGYEAFLAKELGGSARKGGAGWVLGPDAPPGRELCFSHLALREPREIEGASVNALSGSLADFFTTSTQDERFDAPWPFCVESAGESGLARRAKIVAEECLQKIRGRMSRVARLAAPGRPVLGTRRGLFAYMTSFDRVFVSREAWAGGQRRMADDPQAPSRSYLKVEEAYGILGREPEAGESVVDLGAAPGGWSYSAARRGALVAAIDNGPLKGGALHPGIAHRAEDAFKFVPEKPVDWLFCDMVEDPDRVADLLGRWLENGWCRRFVVNLKFGRRDPLALLERAERLRPRCAVFRARHLFHDREELTLVGDVEQKAHSG
ncbi:MAG: rRNA methyltransferase [Elusimicrobia bacterium]|nr:rRNA methyltransferase [Elusimicrobiota bacterium]